MTISLNKNQIKKLLPHREPMLLIDELLNIKGTWVNQTYYNKTKNRGSRRRIEMDNDSIKFLNVWTC